MLKKQPTKLEKEWKNIELGEMQDDNPQIESNDWEQDEGYDLSENRDTTTYRNAILYHLNIDPTSSDDDWD